MNIVSSEFSEIAWNYFLLAKKIAYKNFHQNIDSEHIFLSILQNNKNIKKILELNELNLKGLEEIILETIENKGKMKNKQNNIFIGESLNKVFIKANNIKSNSKEVVISTEHIIQGLIYDKNIGDLILNKKTIPEFLEFLYTMNKDNPIEPELDPKNDHWKNLVLILQNLREMEC
tara:strand:- start:221 stop:745 length:525 start_codon:yes stop_codon:yes gene_type:complete